MVKTKDSKFLGLAHANDSKVMLVSISSGINWLIFYIPAAKNYKAATPLYLNWVMCWDQPRSPFPTKFHSNLYNNGCILLVRVICSLLKILGISYSLHVCSWYCHRKHHEHCWEFFSWSNAIPVVQKLNNWHYTLVMIELKLVLFQHHSDACDPMLASDWPIHLYAQHFAVTWQC